MSGNVFRRTVIAGLLCLVLFAAHSWLLQGMAEWLTVERPNAAADAVAVVGGDLRFDWAAERYQEEPSLTILLFEGPPDRLVDLKISKPTCELDREALHDRGVPAENIQVLTYSQRNEWEWARRLDEWLKHHPGQTVVVVSDQFESSYASFVLDQTVEETRRYRGMVHPLVDRRYDKSNWWKDRRGVKAFWFAAFNLLYAAWIGEDIPPDATWNPDAYEEALGR